MSECVCVPISIMWRGGKIVPLLSISGGPLPKTDLLFCSSRGGTGSSPPVFNFSPLFLSYGTDFLFLSQLLKLRQEINGSTENLPESAWLLCWVCCSSDIRLWEAKCGWNWPGQWSVLCGLWHDHSSVESSCYSLVLVPSVEPCPTRTCNHRTQTSPVYWTKGSKSFLWPGQPRLWPGSGPQPPTFGVFPLLI